MRSLGDAQAFAVARVLLVVTLLGLVAGCRDWPEENIADEHELLALVNDARATGAPCPSGPRAAVAALTWDESLAWAARLHAQDMGQQNYFDHSSLDGRSPFQRMEQEGYGGFPRAENIAAGAPTAAGSFAQWMTSDGHCLNIMDAEATCFGAGHAVVEGSDFEHYWVQTFGVRTP